MSSVEMILAPKTAKIGEKFTVRRALPRRERRMVGPFCFLDHMGPVKVSGHSEGDVLQHPHIGLSTLTYLFSGKIHHRDSLGTEQPIAPGDVNWMTAGKGIAHSERIPLAYAQAEPVLHGLQAWVALPESLETCEPHFSHTPRERLPVGQDRGVTWTLIAGEALGLVSPVPVSSRLFYIRLESVKGGSFHGEFPGQEVGLYLVQGRIRLNDEWIESPNLIFFKVDSEVSFEIEAGSLGVLLGGDPMPEGRKMFWNFVSTKQALIDQAKADWEKGTFPRVSGESEFVPLPKI